ncbi:unnamed protein product [Caenorhabditis brenneri]
MGNLHSAITERVQQRVGQLFDKDWFSRFLLRFRQIRDEIAGKVFNFWQMLQFQQEPTQRHVSGGGPMTRSKRSRGDPYRNPSSFGLYQDQIEVYNNNEMKLVYFVCGINLVLFAFLMRFLFI